MAYYLIEPFGEWRADYRQAITSMILANTNRGKKQKAYQIDDFMPFEEKKKKRHKQQTQDEMMAMLNLLC